MASAQASNNNNGRYTSPMRADSGKMGKIG